MKNGLQYIRRFLKSTGILSIGVILPKVVVFLLLSFNTAHIGTADYGYYDQSISYATMVSYLLFFDIWISTMRFLYEQEEPQGQDKVLRSGGTIFLCSSAVYLLVALVLILVSHPQYAMYTALYGLSQNLISFFSFAARGLRRDTDYAVSGLLGSAVLGVANYLLIARFGWDFSALYLSAILGAAVQCLYLEIRTGCLHRAFRAPADREVTSSLFRFSLPMGIGAAAFWVLNSFDKILLGRMLDLDAGGVYALAERLASLITFAVQVFTYAWQDIAFRHESDDEGAFYGTASSLYFRFLTFGILMLMPAIKLIFPYMFGGDYSGASLVIPFAILAAALSGFSLFLGNVFYALHETRAGTVTSLISCAVNLAVCIPFIQAFGISGASIAIAVTFAFDAVLKGIVLKRKIGYRVPWKTLALSAALVTVGILIYFRCSLAANLIWAAAYLLAFGYSVYRAFRQSRSH